MATTIPFVGQFYDAAFMGLHRTAMGLANTDGLPAETRASSLIGATALVGMSVGLSVLSSETDLGWFRRLSPSRAIASITAFLMGDLEGAVPSLNRLEISPSVQISGGMRQLVGIGAAIHEYSQMAKLTGEDPAKDKKDKEAALKNLADSFLKQTPLIVPASFTGRTPMEMYHNTKELVLGSIIGGDIADPQIVMAAMIEANKAVQEKAGMENATGLPLMPEDNFFYSFLKATSDFNQKIEETLWREKYPDTLPEGRIAPEELAETQRYARAILDRDLAAKEYYRRVSESLKEYDRSKAAAKQLWIGHMKENPSSHTNETLSNPPVSPPTEK